MNNVEYLSQWLKWHEGYESRSRKYFRRAILTLLARIPIGNITYENYKAVIELNINTTPIVDAYNTVYTEIGLLHGSRVGRGINAEVKEYSRPLFSRLFQNNILEWIAENCGLRITSVLDTIQKKIAALIETALENNLTNEQMRIFLQRNLDKGVLTKYELNRIVRTETTGAANHGAMVSGEQSGIVLDKVWISTKDSRTRFKPEDQFDHRVMDNKVVGQYEDFILRSRNGIEDKIQYPGAPNGSAGDIINCRCCFALRPKRDKDGFVIRR